MNTYSFYKNIKYDRMLNIENFFITLILSILIIAGPAIAQENDKDAVYTKLLEKYKGVTTLSLKFSQRDKAGINGRLKAKKGNKYLINLNGRLIISNGKKIWNFSKADNSVVISAFDEEGSELSVEKFFFGFINNFAPQSLSKSVVSNGRNAYDITLSPKKDSKKVSEYKSLVLTIDPDNYNIISIKAVTSAGVQIWDVSNIRLNINIPESVFEFTPPKDAKIIDLK